MVRMNVMRDTEVAPDQAFAPLLAQKRNYHRRNELMVEVIAGWLWMQLNLPNDITRVEMESYARKLVGQIRVGPRDLAVAGLIAALQADQLCRPARLPGLRELADRVKMVVVSA
jgi:hypothetical protein